MIDELEKYSIDYISKTAVGVNIQKVLKTYQKLQEVTANLVSMDLDSQQIIKLGTVLTFSVLNKVSEGVYPKDYTQEDWKKIANGVYENAIAGDGSSYSVLVIKTYEDYIRVSAQVIEKIAGSEKADKIRLIANELETKTEQFKEGTIDEVKYIDDSLWLCLEAIIKLLAAYTTKNITPEVGVLIEAMASYSFEYGRLAMYQREQEILAYYLDCQNEMDEKLSAEYKEFIADLEKKSEEFRNIVAKAFDDDFSEALRGSVGLALSVGVSEDEVLDEVDKIDSFFM